VTLPVLRPDDSQAEPVPTPEWFVGRVRMHVRQGSPDEADIRAVFFDAGAHTRPHTHSVDQILHFLSGTGFVVFPGEERQLMPAGSITVVPGGRLHMHGATEDGAVCQLSVLAPGRTDDWDPPVPDEWRQYAQSQ
jgi:quercetin dioxygenase-like cupin family protein